MSDKKILFISGSLGLGHVGRDLEIAKALREREPDADILWLAEDPASTVLEQAEEKLLPEAKQLVSGNAKLESSAQNYNADLISITMNMRKGWSKNVKMVAEVIKREHFDLVVGDETYDMLIEMSGNPNYKTFPFIIIYDFIGMDSVTRNPYDKIAAYMINRLWSNAVKGEKCLPTGVCS